MVYFNHQQPILMVTNMQAVTPEQIAAVNSLNLSQLCEAEKYAILETIIGIDTEPDPAQKLPVIPCKPMKHQAQSMVMVHPCAAKSAADIAALQLATGLRAVRGNTYARLVQPSERKNIHI